MDQRAGPIVVVIEAESDLAMGTEIPQGLRLGLGEGRCAPVGCTAGAGTGSPVEAPLIPVIPIEVHPEGAIPVLAAIGPPPAAAVRGLLLVVHVPVRVDHRNEVELPVLDQEGGFGIDLVVLEQIVHEVEHGHHGLRFVRVVEAGVEDLDFPFVRLGVVGNFDHPQGPAFDRRPDRLAGRDQVGVEQAHGIQFSDHLVEGVEPTHAAQLQPAHGKLLFDRSLQRLPRGGRHGFPPPIVSHQIFDQDLVRPVQALQPLHLPLVQLHVEGARVQPDVAEGQAGALQGADVFGTRDEDPHLAVDFRIRGKRELRLVGRGPVDELLVVGAQPGGVRPGGRQLGERDGGQRQHREQQERECP